MEVFTVTNQKGGIGKSTTAHNIGAAYSLFMGWRVLLIDLDQQGNLSIATGADRDGLTAYDLLNGKKAEEIAQEIREGLDIIPGGKDLARSLQKLTKTGAEYRLREALEPIKKKYDAVVIDTPPALSILTINALTAADHVIIPAQADLFSLEAVNELGDTLEAVKRYTNKSMKVDGIVLTRYQPRSVLTQDFAELIEDAAKQLKTKVFSARIPEAIAIKEAQAKRQDIFTSAPKSKAAAAYKKLFEEIKESKRHGK